MNDTGYALKTASNGVALPPPNRPNCAGNKRGARASGGVQAARLLGESDPPCYARASPNTALLWCTAHGQLAEWALRGRSSAVAR